MSQSIKPRRVARRTTVNIMLYLGVLAMGLLTYYDYRDRNTEEPAITALAADEIDTIDIHRPGYPSISLTKNGGEWAIDEPFHRQTLAGRVEAVLAIASLDVADSYAANELNAGELGLTTPQATLHLGSENNRLQVLLGGKGPNGQRRYVQVEQRVWLVDDVFLPLVNGGVSALADMQVIGDNSPLATISSETFDISGDDKLAAWQSANAASIVVAADSPIHGNITFTFADGSTHTMGVARDGKQIILLQDGADFALLLTETQALALGIDSSKLGN